MNSWSRARLREAVVTFCVLAAVFVVVALLIENVFGRGHQRVAVEFMLVASLVVAIQSYVGNSGLISFGHVSFYAIGAYVAALAVLPASKKARQVPDLIPLLRDIEAGLWAAIGLAVVAVAIFAALIGVPFARMNASVVPAATLALLVLTHSVINLSLRVTRGPQGLSGIPDLVATPTVLATALFISGAALLYRASPWGLRLQAVREDEVAATALGINVGVTRFIGWMVSAVLMGLGGAVWALNALAFAPAKFYFADTFALLAMLVIGGLGSVTGAVLGAAAITVLAELLRGFERGRTIGPITLPELPGIVQMATAVLILVVLMWRSNGVLGNTEAGGVRWKRR